MQENYWFIANHDDWLDDAKVYPTIADMLADTKEIDKVTCVKREAAGYRGIRLNPCSRAQLDGVNGISTQELQQLADQQPLLSGSYLKCDHFLNARHIDIGWSKFMQDAPFFVIVDSETCEVVVVLQDKKYFKEVVTRLNGHPYAYCLLCAQRDSQHKSLLRYGGAACSNKDFSIAIAEGRLKKCPSNYVFTDVKSMEERKLFWKQARQQLQGPRKIKMQPKAPLEQKDKPEWNILPLQTTMTWAQLEYFQTFWKRTCVVHFHLFMKNDMVHIQYGASMFTPDQHTSQTGFRSADLAKTRYKSCPHILALPGKVQKETVEQFRKALFRFVRCRGMANPQKKVLYEDWSQ